MKKLLTSKDFRELLELNALRKRESLKLQELVSKTQEKGTWNTVKKIDQEILCNEGMRTHEITQIKVEVTLSPNGKEFSFVVRIYLEGDGDVPHHWKTYLERLTFNDAEQKIKMEDDFHWPEVAFKTIEQFNYFKTLVEVIKAETKDLIEALNKS